MRSILQLSLLIAICLTTCGQAAGPPPKRRSGGKTSSASKPKSKGKTPGKPDAETKRRGPQIFDGKSLKGWRVIKKFDFNKHGKIEIKKGELRLGKGNPASGVAWKGKPPRSNYEISLDARRLEGTDFFCGLTFPVGKEYCSLIIGGWGGSVTGLSNVNGDAAVENETTNYVEIKPRRWYRIRLRVTDDRIQAWVDKEAIVDLSRKDKKFSIWFEQEPVRPLGIASWYTAAGLRDIRLKRLPAR